MDIGGGGNSGSTDPSGGIYRWTHLRASANLKKKMKQEVPAAAKRYQEELLAEVNADREAHGKKPLDDEDEPPKAGGKKLEAVVTPGNVHDSVAFDDVYDKLIQSFPGVETVVADAAYKTPHICKKVYRDGRVLSTAHKRPMTMKGGHPWWSYVYKGYEELADDARYTPEYKQLYARRKETVERVFADAKEKHAMHYSFYRGLAQASNWVRLKFAAMNLKKLERWKARKRFAPPSSTPSSYILSLINVVAVWL